MTLIKNVKCTACHGLFYPHEIDNHLDNCPAHTPPKEGESWRDYKTRAVAHARKWREANGVGDAKPQS